MTTKPESRNRTERRDDETLSPRFPATGRTPFFAVIGAVLSAAFSALSIFWDITGNDPEPEEQPLGQFLVVVAVIVVTTVILYVFVVRTAGRGNPGRRSLILGILAAASVILFWLGIPVVIAAAATATAFIQRDRLGRFGGMATVGLALAAISTLATAALAIAG